VQPLAGDPRTYHRNVDRDPYRWTNAATVTPTKPADGYSVQDFADDVEAFMDAVGLTSAVLLGSSSGGYVARHVAVRSANRVTGLVLVGSPSLLGRAPFADEADRLTDPVDRAWVPGSVGRPERVATDLTAFVMSLSA
jgi:pimeloyl-ACP methyl ester carboxylesterase